MVSTLPSVTMRTARETIAAESWRTAPSLALEASVPFGS